MLRWRTWVGRRRTVRDLESLAAALEPCGWRLLRYYRRKDFPVSLPLLRVYASGIERDVGLVIAVRATPRGTWGYFAVKTGRSEFLFACGDAQAAAERIDGLLKHQMYPRTFPPPRCLR
ncbi:hypothetical protein [Spirillospora sp. NPDC048819]|uniref:hypothetical protein n=1 Tax=Spirillospora sp. NPDC048819 TaxID=3155268 RepID=UPI0033D26E3D